MSKRPPVAETRVISGIGQSFDTTSRTSPDADINRTEKDAFPAVDVIERTR
jgi:hypothetical protein